jgi:hypothetical protein
MIGSGRCDRQTKDGFWLTLTERSRMALNFLWGAYFSRKIGVRALQTVLGGRMDAVGGNRVSIARAPD